MHLRRVKVRRGQRTYTYAQVVQGYRRKRDGKPAQRVLMNLGNLSDEEYANWRTALQALREGRPLMVPRAGANRTPIAPTANLDYLDVAVLLEMWNRWGLSALIDELVPPGQSLMAASSVVASLAVQRCICPSPKVESPTWFRKTALPELLGASVTHYNNTRVHRVLDDLADVGPGLMDRLPELYTKRDGAFVSLFLDVTDSWFVGCGPSFAQPATTKEGRFERKINIVLLCNEKGYPLRWDVVPGRRNDSKTMLAVFETIGNFKWARGVPVVCDRALGNTAHLRDLEATGVHYLTALVRPEFPSYSSALPYEPLLDFKPAPAVKGRPDPEDVKRVAAIIEEAGMERVDDNLYVLDLGRVTYAGDRDEEDEEATFNTAGESTLEAATDRVAEAMRLGRKILDATTKGLASGYRSAGQALGLTRRQAQTRLKLTALPLDIQEALLRGEGASLKFTHLLRLAKNPDPKQQKEGFALMLNEAAAQSPPRRSRVARQSKRPKQPKPPRPRLRVRAVSYFNPEMFVQMRLNAQARLDDIERYRSNLNTTLAKPETTRKLPAILSAVDAKLRKARLLEIFSVEVRTVLSANGIPRYQVDLVFNQQAWIRRRRHDGFCLLVGHRDITGTASQLCRFYRDKDAVEKDFRTIKSFIALRPFHHRLDAKIRAHVSIYMLALLLERTLQDRLAAGGLRISAQAALASFETCHLNYYAPEHERPGAYNLTKVPEQQHKLLRALRLTHLVDEKEVSSKIQNR